LVHAMCIDVAGQDEAMMRSEGLGNPGRDSVTCSIIGADRSTLATLQAPTYRALERHGWQGENHLAIFGKLKALADRWRPLYIVIDATGVGEGLWAMLDKAFPTRVIPVKFTQQTKSEIGYGFLAIIETGRFRDCCPTPEVDQQYAACTAEALTGPQKILRWGVPDGTRGPDGELIHDDHVIADSLCAVLDKLSWSVPFKAETFIPRDPLKDMDRSY